MEEQSYATLASIRTVTVLTTSNVFVDNADLQKRILLNDQNPEWREALARFEHKFTPNFRLSIVKDREAIEIRTHCTLDERDAKNLRRYVTELPPELQLNVYEAMLNVGVPCPSCNVYERPGLISSWPFISHLEQIFGAVEAIHFHQ